MTLVILEIFLHVVDKADELDEMDCFRGQFSISCFFDLLVRVFVLLVFETLVVHTLSPIKMEEDHITHSSQMLF